MAATTTQRPPALPGQNPQQGGPRVPKGAAKMARMYLDEKGIPTKSPTPVPVDADDRRTLHEQHQCPHMAVINGGGRERCDEKEWLLPDDKAPFCRAHGKQLERVKRGPSQLEQVVRATRSMHGRSAAPWLLPLGMAGADLAAHVAELGVLEMGMLAPAAAGATYVVAKRTLTRRAVARQRIEKGQKSGRRYERIKEDSRRYAWYAGEAGLWAAALAGTDITHLPGAIIAGLGMLRWGLACRTWWATADQRRTSAAQVSVHAPDIPVAAEPEPVQLRAETTWSIKLGNQSGPLPGTKLEDFRRLPNVQVGASERTLLPNWTAKVVAKDHGSINMREYCTPTRIGRIAAAYGCTLADVSFAADEADLSVGWVRVQPDNPLAQIRMWTGPESTDWNKGVSIVGRYDDGQPIEYVWWDEGGGAHDLLGGSSGGGKSEFIAQLLLTSLHSQGLVLDWVGDPQSGQSFGALKNEVDWFGPGTTEIEFMLLAAVKEMYRRNEELSRNYIKTWRPTTEMPLLVITLDEVQSYLGDTGVVNELVTLLAGMGRKCGFKLRLSTQIIAAYNLGGDTYIKDQTKTGQTFTFRSETDQAARSAVEGDSPIDPTALPKRWGPYTCAPGKKTAGLVFVQGARGREVYGRTDWTGDDMKTWLVDADGKSTLTPGRFCKDAQDKAGVLWGDRKERARRLLEAGRDDAEILSGGKALELIEAASVAAVTQTIPKVGQEPDSQPLADRARDIVFTAAMELADGNGVVNKPALVEATKDKVAAGTLNKALTDLVSDGFLTRMKNGVYMVAGGSEKPQAVDAEQVEP